MFCNSRIRFLRLLSNLKYSTLQLIIVKILFFLQRSTLIHQFIISLDIFYLFNPISSLFPYCIFSHFGIGLKIWRGCLLYYASLDLKPSVNFLFFIIVRRHSNQEFSAGRGIRTLETFRSQAFLTIPGLRPTRLGDPGSKSFKFTLKEWSGKYNLLDIIFYWEFCFGILFMIK